LERALETFDAGEVRKAAATFLHHRGGLQRSLSEEVDALLARVNGSRSAFKAELRLLCLTPTSNEE
jgi:hypothetical protein